MRSPPLAGIPSQCVASFRFGASGKRIDDVFHRRMNSRKEGIFFLSWLRSTINPKPSSHRRFRDRQEQNTGEGLRMTIINAGIRGANRAVSLAGTLGLSVA